MDELSTVNINHSIKKELQIKLNSNSLNVYGLDMLQVYHTIYANTLNIPLGGFDSINGIIS